MTKSVIASLDNHLKNIRQQASVLIDADPSDRRKAVCFLATECIEALIADPIEIIGQQNRETALQIVALLDSMNSASNETIK